MAGKSANSLGAKNWAPGPPATRYNVSGKNREFYTFENAPGLGAYASGGTIVDGGDGYIYHIFTGDGTFSVNRPPAAIDSVDYMIVAGGGASGSGNNLTLPGGAGGAGGMLLGNIIVSNSPGSYSISVGGGGASNGPSNPSVSRHGFDSSAFGLTAEGGGGGGGNATLPTVPLNSLGDPGGSGGGAYSYPPATGRPGGTGNTPATIPRQGYPGAPLSMPNSLSPAIGGGGGGAGGEGGYVANGEPSGPPYAPRGYGGPGRLVPQFPIPIIGKAIPSENYPVWYADVAEGSTYSGKSGGGLAAGGRAWPPPSDSSPQLNATANTGHGGIGQTTSPGFNGGSGIVCIRYRKAAAYSRATGGTIEPNTHPEHPGVWRHIFTSPGDFTVTDPTLQWIDYLAVGGGGAGGDINPATAGGGGGGGAGGFVSSIHTSTTTPTTIPEAYPWNPGYSVRVAEQYPVSVGTYPIGIGTGGVTTNTPRNGYPTTIGSPGANQIIAYGGGGGATIPGSGGSGGSGGGSSTIGPVIPGGAASPSPGIQGNNGGTGTPSPSIRNAGGGGGAGGSGTSGPGSGTAPFPGVAGGVGWYSVLSPSEYGTPGPLTPTAQYRYFAGGGGSGGTYWLGGTTSPSPGGAGGAGGGGNGGAPPASPGTSAATPGTTNTGGGGGGAGSAGGDGGPGIVIIQYPE